MTIAMQAEGRGARLTVTGSISAIAHSQFELFSGF